MYEDSFESENGNLKILFSVFSFPLGVSSLDSVFT